MLEPSKFRKLVWALAVVASSMPFSGLARGGGGGGHGGGGHSGGGHASSAGRSGKAANTSSRSSMAIASAMGKSRANLSNMGASGLSSPKGPCPTPGSAGNPRCLPRPVFFSHGFGAAWWWNDNSSYEWYYEELGRHWADQLRRETMTWNQLLVGVQEQVLIAPAGSRNSFRRGFLSGYGKGGRVVFTKAVDQARAAVRPAP